MAASRYARLLAVLRSRTLGAVTMPALVGAAWSARQGRFHLAPFLLVLAGLAAAELLNLFGIDMLRHLKGDSAGPKPLPGNPVVAPRLLPGRRLPAVLAVLAVVGLAVLAYFAVTVGWGVLALLASAVAIGGLYVLSPFPQACLSTSFLPPLLVGGTVLAVSGELRSGAFLAGLPVALISLGVILTYCLLYGREGSYARKLAAVAGAYLLAAVSAAVLAAWRLYPLLALATLASPALLAPWAVRLALRERRDPVPATAVGVLMHHLFCVLLAASVLLG